MTDIKTAMRIAYGPDALSYATDEIERLRAENERLRALIETWVQADAVVQHQKNLNRYSGRSVPTVFSAQLFKAAEALRAEVAR